MMVHVSGGRSGVIKPLFMIFQNKECNFPIQGRPDDVPGISYRTGKKGWMDQRVMALMLKEKRFLKRRADGRKHIIFIDNVGSHNTNPGARESIERTQHRASIFFPKCNAFNSTL